MDIETLANESGFIPTECMSKWRLSLTEAQRTALDDYTHQLWSDALYDESIKQMEASNGLKETF